MGQEYNLAGKTLVVDKIKQLKSGSAARSAYVRTVTKSALVGKKAEQEFKIQGSISLLERDDTRRDSQIVNISAKISGYNNALPRFEINGLPRICAFSTGEERQQVIKDLQNRIDNQTPFTPMYSGVDNWSRGGLLFEVGDTVSVLYLCSDSSYVTAIMSVISVGDYYVTGLVLEILQTSRGFDDRDSSNTVLYVPYTRAVPLDISLYNNNSFMDFLRLEVQDKTRHRRTFGHGDTLPGTTYTENGVEFNHIEGDSFVLVESSGGTQTSTIYFRFQDSWVWLADYRAYSRYDEILIESLPDVYSIYGTSDNHISAAGYDWFKQVIAEHISAIYYFVGGAIYGYGQNGYVDMTKPVGQRAFGSAFILDANGVMEISEGYARDMKVRGSLNLYADNGTDAGAQILHPALTTTEGTEGDSTGVVLNEPTAWSIKDLYDGNTFLEDNTFYSTGDELHKSNYDGTNLTGYVFKNTMGTSRTVEKSLYNGEGSALLDITVAGLPSGFVKVQGWYERERSTTAMDDNCSIRLYLNGVLKSTRTVSKGRLFPTSTYGELIFNLDIPDNSTIRIVTTGEWEYAKSLYRDERITITDTFSNYTSNGVWIQKSSDSSYVNLGTDDVHEESLNLNIGGSNTNWYKSSEHLNYCLPTNVTNYSSYTTTDPDTGVATIHEILQDVTYKASGTLLYNGTTSLTVTMFTRTREGANVSCSDGTTLLLLPTQYVYLSGFLAIAESDDGVEMMGCYPKEADTYDFGLPLKHWNYGFFNYLYGTVLGQSSRRSLKEDIVPFERKALDIINGTEIVRYRFKSDKTHTPIIGFIADDTDKDISGENHDSMLTTNCIGVLIKAVQELSGEVEKLKVEIRNR